MKILSPCSSLVRGFAAVSFLFLSIGHADSVQASHNLLENSDFDVGLAGWLFETSGDGQMMWDPSLGDPSAGSLRISGSRGATGWVVGEALSSCFQASADQRLVIEARSFAETTGGPVRCVAYFLRYEGFGCQGERGFLGNVSGSQDPGVWVDELAILQAPASGTPFRVALLAGAVNDEGEVACNFDSVTLAVEGAIHEIPVTSVAGLLALCTALAAAALWVLSGKA